MSVFTYSRTSICQDVAGLVNKVAVFVVLDGGRSWALHMGRRNRYQRRMPREDPISGVECTVWWPGSHWSTIGPRVFVFMMDEHDGEAPTENDFPTVMLTIHQEMDQEMSSSSLLLLLLLFAC